MGRRLTKFLTRTQRCLHTVCVTLNVILMVMGNMFLVLAAICYMVPKTSAFIEAVNNMFHAHFVLGGSIVLGYLAIVFGYGGVLALYYRNVDTVAIQLCMLVLYVVITAVITFVTYNDWTTKLNVGMLVAVQTYDLTQSHSRYMDSVQVILDCCGRAGPADYYSIANVHFDAKVKSVPTSCCVKANECEFAVNKSYPAIHEMGCIDSFDTMVRPVLISMCGAMCAFVMCYILCGIMYVALDLSDSDGQKSEYDENEVARLTSSAEHDVDHVTYEKV